MPNSYLIVVDMQNDFIDGALGTPEAQAIVEGVVERARAFEGRVVFTRDTHGPNYASTQEGRNLPVPHCIKGTQGWELAPALDEIQRLLDAPVFDKPSFGSLDLARWLVAQNGKTTPSPSTPSSFAACARTSAWSATPSPSRRTCRRCRSA